MGNSTSKPSRARKASPAPLDLSKSTYEGIVRSQASPHLTLTPASPASPYITTPSSVEAALHNEEKYGAATFGDNNISLPLRRNHKRNLSELIDPMSLAVDGEYVQSPSGNLLCSYDFTAREDRPLSLRERQERIRQQMNRNSVYAVSGISPKPSSPRSPRSPNPPMVAIPEEQLEIKPPKPVKQKSLCCF